MIEKKITKKDAINWVSYDEDKLSEKEVEFACYHWKKGWNAFMKILPNILKDEVLLSFEEALEDSNVTPDSAYFKGKESEKFVPYNRDYSENRKSLTEYFIDGLAPYQV